MNLLSCYTTALADYREAAGDPIDLALARVELLLRADDEGIEFTHHEWWGNTHGGSLAYRAVNDADAAQHGLLAEIDRHGMALAVTNTSLMPWSITAATMTHWVLLKPSTTTVAVDVHDAFSALLPAGQQDPHTSTVRLAELVGLMRLPEHLSSSVRARDKNALGRGISVPDGTYRWLELGKAVAEIQHPTAIDGWTQSTHESLNVLARLLVEQPDLLEVHIEDIWAASRHQVAALTAAECHGIADDTALIEAWTALPRSLRFCLDSANRGRPRPSMISRSLEHLAHLESQHRALKEAS